jgi:alginate O-acetyltransferase complex protein AlgF
MTRCQKPALMALSLLLTLSFTPLARAADDGLYAAAPPPGSAFVRFVNAESAQSLKGSVRGKAFPTLSAGHAGPYMPVAQGDAAINLGSASATHTLKPGGHYSAISMGGRLVVLDEPVNDNKLKTQIILINASKQKDITLKTADGSVSVIDAVAPGQLNARQVNPVKTGFSVYAGGNKVASLNEQSLERGAGYAVVVYDGASGPVASLDKASGS